MMLEPTTLIFENQKIFCSFLLRDENVVILHGAGESESSRYSSLAEECLSNGLGVVLFDFSGHGRSSGSINELSLLKRAAQARYVIDTILPSRSDFYLIGFSMSGQTVCDLLPIYGNRIKSIILACPAIYREDVNDVEFGDERFTRLIREEQSWRTSKAPALLHSFPGRVILAIGSEDAVIPAGVEDLIRGSQETVRYIQYRGATHQLAKWLQAHPTEQSELIGSLFS